MQKNERLNGGSRGWAEVGWLERAEKWYAVLHYDRKFGEPDPDALMFTFQDPVDAYKWAEKGLG